MILEFPEKITEDGYAPERQRLSHVRHELSRPEKADIHIQMAGTADFPVMSDAKDPENVRLSGSAPPVQNLVVVVLELGQDASIDVRLFKDREIGLTF